MDQVCMVIFFVSYLTSDNTEIQCFNVLCNNFHVKTVS